MELIGFSKYEILGIIADGMGGFQHGNLASQFSVDRFVDLYLSGRISVDEILSKINKEMLYYSSGTGRKDRIGTTFLAIEILYNKLNFFSVGDSSVFLFRNKKLKCLNKHQEKKGYLTNYLGYSNFNEIEKGRILLEKGDIVLMCSDGLTKFMSFQNMEDIIKKYKNRSSQKLAEILTNEVIKKENPKQDNVSIIVIKQESSVGKYEERGSKVRNKIYK